MQDAGQKVAAGSALDATRIAALAALAVILAVAAYLRFNGLGAQSIWSDEAVSWLQAQGNVIDIVRATAGDNYPPLHNLFLAISIHLFGDSEAGLRLPSAIFGVLTVPALYWVGTMAGGRTAGLLAALLMAFSAFHIWYSQEARAYTLLALTATLFAGTSLWLLREMTLPRVLAAIIAAIALLYSHPFGTFAWLSISFAMLLVVIFRPTRDGATPLVWILMQVVAGMAFAPWAWLLMQRANVIQARGFWIDYPTPRFVIGQLSQAASGTPALIVLLVAALLAFFVWSPGSGRRTPIRFSISGEAWIVIAWLLGPLVISIGISLVGTPVFIARYVICSVPAFLVIAALGLSRIAVNWAAVTLAALIALAASVLGLVYGKPAPHEDWRAAVNYMTANVPAGGCILIPWLGVAKVIYYYMRHPIDCALFAGPDVPDYPTGYVLAVSAGLTEDLTRYLPAPRWQRHPTVEFQDIRLVPFTRAGG